MRKLSLIALLILGSAYLFSMSPLTVESSSGQELKLRFRAPQLEISTQRFDTQDFHKLSMSNASETPDSGAPSLPILGGSIILPASGSYELSVTPIRSKTISGIRPLPAYDWEGSKSSPRFEPDKYYGAPSRSLVEPGEVAVLRDFRILQFSVNPVQWNFQTEELKVFEEIEIAIRFTGGSSATDMVEYTGYSPAFRRIYEANLLNFNDYRSLNNEDSYGKILMIYGHTTNAVYLALMNNFANWKRTKGHDVNVVSTQTAGNTSTAIKNYIQTQYNNPSTRPDYVIFVGDTPQIPTFFESMSGYNGEGDYPYTFLAGEDMLGDVFIGRISVETADQLDTVLEKTYRYERDIFMDSVQEDWLNRILLIGDPSTSGISCVYNSKYIKELAEYANPDYDFIENYSGGYTTTINSAINQGISFFSYRGYIGMSGWSPGSSLNNGPRLPHAVILTCGTGNFGSSYGTGTTESFIRLGTSANPSGAVTAIGMATSGTHTMFNNTLNAAIHNGIFAHNMRSMGEALLHGRLYIRQVYGATHSNSANYFAHWCNLMGDPSMEVFVGIPEELMLLGPETVTTGSSLLDYTVVDSSGNPVANASVTAYNSDTNSVVARGYTDQSGTISLYISGGVNNSLVISAAKNDHVPAQLMVFSSGGGLVYQEKTVFEDGSYGSSGNGDTFASAGERAAVMLTIRNTSGNTITGISGTVTTDDPYVSLITQSITFPDLPAGQSAIANEYVLFDIAENVPGNHDVRLFFTLSDASGTDHEFPVHQVVYNAVLEVETINILAGGNNILDPTETGSLNLGILNSSVAGIHNLNAQLFSMNDLVLVEDSEAYIGSIAPGMIGVTLDSFGLFARSLLVPGMQIPFRIRFSNDSGFEQDAFFNISIGSVGQNTPMGPDSYGYFIYDMNDTQFIDCPTYEWLEINPTLGGQGTKITSLNDGGASYDEGDQVGAVSLAVLNLPFSFPFYGIPYQQITVSTNGFIAMGTTENAEFRNSRLPGGLGPSPMIAAFWDDLATMGDSGIYYYYNPQEHIYIVEYDKLRNGYNQSSLETFQVIFYDPLYHPTSYGDGKIKIQYKDFNNVDSGGSGYPPLHGNYATIGIKDHTNTRGLEYSYNNQWAPGASPLTHGSALMITTVPVLHESPFLVVQDLIVTDANGNSIPEPGETIELGIRLANQGLNTATEAGITATLNHPYAQLINNASQYPDIPGDSGEMNIEPITVYIVEECPNNTVIELTINVSNGEAEWSYPISFTVSKPSVTVSGYMMNDASGNGNGLVDPGENIDLVVNFSNHTDVDANNVSANIMSVSQYVTFGNNSAFIDRLPAHSTVQVVYPITLSPETPFGNNVTFYVSYMGDLIEVGSTQLIVSVGTTGMSENFENNNGYFEPSPNSNGWEWGVSDYAGAHSGTKIWGTRLNSNFQLGSTYNLTSQPVYIGSNFMLEFWHRFHTGSANAGGNVKISTNGGSVWQVITPEGGYPVSGISPLSGPGYQGNTEDWMLARFPLASYANQTVQFRFTFSSATSGTAAQGWFIDDVRTSGYLAYAGKISGQVSSSDPAINFANVFVHSEDNISTVPNEEGFYTLYLPMHTQLVSASAEGYYGADPVELALTSENPVITQDYYLGYLKPVVGITRSIADGVLSLNWEAPQEPEYEVYSYKLYRRFGGGAYELVSEAAGTGYQENLSVSGEYHFYVKVMYLQGESTSSPVLSFTWGGSDSDGESQSPIVSKLMGNYPNPFNPETTIAFALATASNAQLSVYNLKGQKVADLHNGFLPAGEHRKVWNGRDNRGISVSSGIYLIRLSTQDSSFTRKMMLMK